MNGSKNHFLTSTRPQHWYQHIGRSCQSPHHNDSLNQCHYISTINYPGIYNPIPGLLVWYYPYHSPPIRSNIINIIQCQSTVSCLAQMHVDGGSNCHDFWDKYLLYVLFFYPIMFKFLLDPTSQLPAWDLSLSSYQVHAYSNHWLCPNGTTQNAQSTSTSVP